MIIAITGATGFIGKRLVNHHLELGHEVRILSRKKINSLSPKVKLYNGHLLSDGETLKKFTHKVDVLYHCAAEIKNNSLMYEVNVLGTKNLLLAAKSEVKHWVQLSSTGVYGPLYNGIIDEKQIPNPKNDYEGSKLESDKLVMKAGKEKWFTYTIIRPSNVFGPDMTNQSLFQLIKAIDNGRYFYIGKTGANANYVSVENVIEILYQAATNKLAIGKIYNISDQLPLEKFIEAIADFLGKPKPKLRMPNFFMRLIGFIGDAIPSSPITTSRVRALTNRVSYSNDLVVHELGYLPKVDILSTLKKMVEVYKENKI
ncbi:NAD-dependent epimerase/dehydratase family protein [Pedobacter aquatilis]|uniref:NAD-dependent epimerase/dehydratase family protein n=1 Tax=Pedobacter aquatilis TaxID=351343 RepID=UPI00293131EE|nr:NAD-dependent epimerase/dehydratase family protein [Pedobacter aquatilis]